MKDIITVLVKHPGHPPHMVMVKNELEPLQKLVSGYIETVTICSDLVLICNEDGLLRGLPDNCQLCGMQLVGTIILAGVDGEEFDSCPLTISQAKKLFPQLWEV